MIQLFREFIISLGGHILLFIGFIISTIFTHGTPTQMISVQPITTVTQQQIEQLQRKDVVREERVSKVPQVQVKKDEVIPKPTRRKKQPIKQPESPEKKQSGKEQKGSQIKGIKTDTEFDYPDYLIELRNRIIENWNYPQAKESLATTVYFRLAQDGRIISIKVEKATGNVRFDRSAWEAVQKSNPFPPLPEGFKENELGVHFNFIFEPI